MDKSFKVEVTILEDGTEVATVVMNDEKKPKKEELQPEKEADNK